MASVCPALGSWPARLSTRVLCCARASEPGHVGHTCHLVPWCGRDAQRRLSPRPSRVSPAPAPPRPPGLPGVLDQSVPSLLLFTAPSRDSDTRVPSASSRPGLTCLVCMVPARGFPSLQLRPPHAGCQHAAWVPRSPVASCAPAHPPRHSQPRVRLSPGHLPSPARPRFQGCRVERWQVWGAGGARCPWLPLLFCERKRPEPPN